MKERLIISTNRSINHDYFIINTIQVGICLLGSEVKTCRSLFSKTKNNKCGSVQLKGSYIDISKDMQMTLVGANISCYSHASDYFNHNPTRSRILLAHKREIIKLYKQVKERGLTIVPNQMYFFDNKIKLDICVVRGKHNYDKRDDLKKKQVNIDYNRRIK